MTIPLLLQDIIRLLLALATPAALLALVCAGIALWREGGTTFWIGGSFSRWMFWAVTFLTLPQLLSWFSFFGLLVPLPAGGGIGTAWLDSLRTDVTAFIQNFVIAYLTPILAAYFVLRSILDTASGGHPLPSILAAMFLLAIPSTAGLLQGWNTGTRFATGDLLANAWTYLATRIMPIVAGLAIVGAIINFATHKPTLKLVACALAFLSVSAIWRLVVRMMS